MAELGLPAGHHAEPELLDHLSLYKDTEELLLWHEAFANVLLISRRVPENRVADLATILGLSYQ